MFGMQYQGAIENLSQRQLEFISEVLKNQGYEGKQVIVSTLGKIGDNYASFVKRFTVELENGKVFKMIGKIAPSIDFEGNPSPVSDIFKNESLLYNEVLPKFSQMQKSVGIPEEDKLKYPLCYGTLSEPLNEIILLEDLNFKNYVILDKRQPLTDQVIKMVLQNMAKFHSMSFVLKNKEPQTYKLLSGKLVNIFLNNVAIAKVETLYKAMLDGMKSIFNDDRYINAIDSTMNSSMRKLIKILIADKGSKYSILQHGDMWTNNFMFQMQGNDPVDCILIDYQLVRESSPVADIHSLIFNCTDYKTRSKHYYEWIDYYHSELEKYLNYFELKVNYVYPRDKYDADLKRYGKLCLGLSIEMLNILLRESQEAPDITAMLDTMEGTKMATDLGMNTLMSQTVEAIKNRIEGLIDSCFEYGYLTDMTKSSFK